MQEVSCVLYGKTAITMHCPGVTARMNQLDQPYLKLVIHPSGDGVENQLRELGFCPIVSLPQLWCLEVPEVKLVQALRELSQALPEEGQTASRIVVTSAITEGGALLLEFLKAQSVREMTCLVRHGWFLEILSRRAFFFHYQPIFHLASNQVVAYECLARAKTPDGEELGGHQLITAAQATRRIHEFDTLARKTCLQILASLLRRSSYLRHQQFFINVLPNAIGQNLHGFERHLEQVLESGIAPQQLVFELTEIESVRQSAALRQAIQRLREWGCGLAIDDLGSKVPLDHYCLELQPDVVKLDRALVAGCSRYPMKQMLLQGILQASQGLGIRVLAEGIENLEDLAFCRKVGVDLAQGFALARPHSLPIASPLPLMG